QLHYFYNKLSRDSDVLDSMREDVAVGLPPACIREAEMELSAHGDNVDLSLLPATTLEDVYAIINTSMGKRPCLLVGAFYPTEVAAFLGALAEYGWDYVAPRQLEAFESAVPYRTLGQLVAFHACVRRHAKYPLFERECAAGVDEPQWMREAREAVADGDPDYETLGGRKRKRGCPEPAAVGSGSLSMKQMAEIAYRVEEEHRRCVIAQKTASAMERHLPPKKRRCVASTVSTIPKKKKRKKRKVVVSSDEEDVGDSTAHACCSASVVCVDNVTCYICNKEVGFVIKDTDHEDKTVCTVCYTMVSLDEE
ncbi:MAG: hypothetical protein DRI61_10355, partial [Chloroflexi bacterium]